MLFDDLNKSLENLKQPKVGKLSESQEKPHASGMVRDLLNAVTEMQEGVQPDLTKDIDAVIKALLEKAMKEEDEKDVEQKEGKTYLGISGDNALYATIVYDSEAGGDLQVPGKGRMKTVTVYDAGLDELKKFENEEGLDNAEMLMLIVQDMNMDSVSFKLIQDLNLLKTEEKPEDKAKEEQPAANEP